MEARRLMQERWQQFNQQVRRHFLLPEQRQCLFYFIECSLSATCISDADGFDGFDSQVTSTPPDSIEAFYTSIVTSTARGSHHPAEGHYLRIFKDYEEACKWAEQTQQAKRFWTINGKVMDNIVIFTADLEHEQRHKSPIPATEHLVVHRIPDYVLTGFREVISSHGNPKNTVSLQSQNWQKKTRLSQKTSETMHKAASRFDIALKTYLRSENLPSLLKPPSTEVSKIRDSENGTHNRNGTPIPESLQPPQKEELEESEYIFMVRQILASRISTIKEKRRRRSRKQANERVQITEYLVDWEPDGFGNSWRPEWTKSEDVGHQNIIDWKVKEDSWQSKPDVPKVFHAIVFDEKYHGFEDGSKAQGWLVKWEADIPLSWMKKEDVKKDLGSTRLAEYSKKNREWTAMKKKWEKEVARK